MCMAFYREQQKQVPSPTSLQLGSQVEARAKRIQNVIKSSQIRKSDQSQSTKGTLGKMYLEVIFEREVTFYLCWRKHFQAEEEAQKKGGSLLGEKELINQQMALVAVG